MNRLSPKPLPPGKFAAGLFTIRSYLLLLIAAVIVPMMVLVAILAWDYGTAGRRTIEAERLDTVNNVKHLMDREIQSAAGFLNGLATLLASIRPIRASPKARSPLPGRTASPRWSCTIAPAASSSSRRRRSRPG